MNVRSAIIIGIVVILSFIAGFVVANTFNRKEIDELKVRLASAESAETANNVEKGNDSQMALSDDEIKKAIAQADSAPENIELQKNVGIKLYQYALSLEGAPDWLPETLRLLDRVNKKDPKDFETLTAIANANLYWGESKKDQKSIEKAREFYKKALEIKPGNADVAADIGLTYLLSNPVDPENAVTELNKSLKIDPKHERSLANMVRAMILSNKPKEANEWLGKLKEANPESKLIPALSNEIAKSNSSSQKQ